MSSRSPDADEHGAAVGRPVLGPDHLPAVIVPVRPRLGRGALRLLRELDGVVAGVRPHPIGRQPVPGGRCTPRTLLLCWRVVTQVQYLLNLHSSVAFKKALCDIVNIFDFFNSFQSPIRIKIRR
jgi:hypothetical protein